MIATAISVTAPIKAMIMTEICKESISIDVYKRQLESRPLPQRDFDYMFYFDIDSEVHSEEFVRLINQLEELSHEFKYLGSYMEI